MDRLRELLIRHEGLKLKPYVCTSGKLSIGVGRNLESVGITELEAMLLLANDINRVTRQTADAFAWFKSISVPRQDVVLSMVFNLGLGGFKNFKKMIEAIRNADFNKAATEMLDSRWAKQVGLRAEELAYIMRYDRYPR